MTSTYQNAACRDNVVLLLKAGLSASKSVGYWCIGRGCWRIIGVLLPIQKVAWQSVWPRNKWCGEMLKLRHNGWMTTKQKPQPAFAKSNRPAVEVSGWQEENTMTESGVSVSGSETTSNPSNESSGRPARSNSATKWLSLLAAGLLVAGGVFVVGVSIGAFDEGGILGGDAGSGESAAAIPVVYDANRAFSYLKQVCDFGSRPTGSPGMQRQQQALTDFFRQRGAEVELQELKIRHPETGDAVTLGNLIARFGVDRPKRYLICAHYDTRPFPDRDRSDKQGNFVGANDGGSGTAALMELSHHLDDLPPDVGVDLVLFDAEELVFVERRDKYFLGSEHFASEYRRQPPATPYQAGILLDMVGDKELKVYYERNSLKYAPDVARDVWRTAAKLGVNSFVARSRHEIRDDHLPLNQIAGIPTIDIIDFDYPRPGLGAPKYWHTTQDVPENCSGESLVTVVWVVHEWLKGQ